MVRLYQIPKGSKLKLSVSKDGENFSDEFVTYHRIDGMYAYCTVDGWPDEEAPVHPNAFIRLMKDGDVYVMEENQEKDEDDAKTQDDKRNINQDAVVKLETNERSS